MRLMENILQSIFLWTNVVQIIIHEYTANCLNAILAIKLWIIIGTILQIVVNKYFLSLCVRFTDE